MSINSFFTPFSFQGLDRIERELYSGTGRLVESDVRLFFHYFGKVCVDFSASLPVVGQIWGGLTIREGVGLWRSHKYHAVAVGMIVRGVVQFANLGILWMPVDIIKTIVHHVRGTAPA